MKKSNDALAPRPLDHGKAIRGKYYGRMQKGTNLILIAPDLVETFPDSESVNQALRGLKKLASRAAKSSGHQEKTVSVTQ